MNRKKYLSLLFSFTLLLFLGFVLLRNASFDTDSRFSSYATSLFRQEVSSNTITLHYTLSDPSKYQIKGSSVSFGHICADPFSVGASSENALARLHTFNRSRLSAENQLLYDLLEENFTSAVELSPYTLYDEPLSPLTGTQSQLPILLSEYTFHSLDDVNTYLDLLEELPSYFQEILTFEQEKALAGLFMSDDRVASVIKECETFVGMGDSNYLYETFEKRLGELDGFENTSEFQKLVSRNARCIEESVFPAYELLIEGLRDLLGSCQNEAGLCYFPNGKSYYELLIGHTTGSDRSILEMETLTLKQINEDMNAVQNILDSGDISLPDNGIFTDSNPQVLLASLKEKLADNFPAPPEVNVSVKYVDASMADYLSPAFYLTPPIDHFSENTIYINPKHLSDEISLFTTLAHEGYPGHLYQATYYAAQSPAPLRSLLNCGSYTEGWATYCEMMSYYWLPVSKQASTLLQKNASASLGLYAYADIGIHYEGWSFAETLRFFREYGITDRDGILEIYNLILGDPGNYLKYYIGYLEFLELKKDALAAWGTEFTQERFHCAILETGPVPFGLLRRKMGLGTG